MTIAQQRDENLDELAPDQIILVRPEWGSITMAAMAASFDAGVPAAMAAANATLFWTLEKDGDFSISNGGGPLDLLSDAQIAERKKDEDDAWDEYADVGERREEERREREWGEGTYDFAGTQMSGDDIDALVEFIRDPAQRQKLIERRARDKGISPQQAAKDVDNAARYGELFKKVRMGTASPAETDEYNHLKSDPNVIETVKMTEAAKLESLHAPTVSDKTSQLSGDQRVSTGLGSDIMEASFPSAPIISEHFEAAKNATEPLDVQKLPLAQIASVAPSPQVASSGFDV